ncbi:MAG: excalibur calcium-binding domain-containing protein [Patescibacteria group bacterium]
MFIPNLIFGLVFNVFNVLLTVIGFPFHLVFGFVKILLSPVLAIFLLFHPGQIDNSMESTLPNTNIVASRSVSSYYTSGSSTNHKYISGSCKYLESQGLSHFIRGDANYTPKRDRDNDGIACE